jgi:predicted phage terminase large subunit-like protein
LPNRPNLIRIRSWDLASTPKTTGTDPDWTVGALVCRDVLTGEIFIDDVIRFRGTPHEVESTVVATAAKDGKGTQIRIPRDPGQSGVAQIQNYAGKLMGYRTSFTPEKDSKTYRAQIFAAQCEAGNVRLVGGDWNAAFIDEFCAFGAGGSHDDQVDAISSAMNLLVGAYRGPLTSYHGSADDAPRRGGSGLRIVRVNPNDSDDIKNMIPLRSA